MSFRHLHCLSEKYKTIFILNYILTRIALIFSHLRWRGVNYAAFVLKFKSIILINLNEIYKF